MGESLPLAIVFDRGETSPMSKYTDQRWQIRCQIQKAALIVWKFSNMLCCTEVGLQTSLPIHRLKLGESLLSWPNFDSYMTGFRQWSTACVPAGRFLLYSCSGDNKIVGFPLIYIPDNSGHRDNDKISPTRI